VWAARAAGDNQWCELLLLSFLPGEAEAPRVGWRRMAGWVVAASRRVALLLLLPPLLRSPAPHGVIVDVIIVAEDPFVVTPLFSCADEAEATTDLFVWDMGDAALLFCFAGVCRCDRGAGVWRREEERGGGGNTAAAAACAAACVADTRLLSTVMTVRTWASFHAANANPTLKALSADTAARARNADKAFTVSPPPLALVVFVAVLPTKAEAAETEEAAAEAVAAAAAA